MGGVYLRYRDAIRAFPDCWLWHPEVVEELLWLHRAWIAAYSGQAPPTRSGGLARPATARVSCTGSVSTPASAPSRLICPDGIEHGRAPEMPVVDAVAAMARWWATDRAEPGPEPTERAAHSRRGSPLATPARTRR